MSEGAAMIAGVVLLVAIVVLVVKARKWVPWVRYRLPKPGKLHGLTVNYVAPHVYDDRVVDRLWAIPVYMQNDGSRPFFIPVMANDAFFWSNRRTGWGRVRTQYKGHLRHDDIEYEEVQPNGVVARRVLNPGDTPVVFTAYVKMPQDQRPELLHISSFDDGLIVKSIRDRVPQEPER